MDRLYGQGQEAIGSSVSYDYTMGQVLTKRIYEAQADEDGYRVLVDRLWPRGVSKEKADLDLWLKEVAPSTMLRKWFNHDESKWPEFLKRYRIELDSNPAWTELKEIVADHDTTTLLYGARDTTNNEAIALVEFLDAV